MCRTATVQVLHLQLHVNLRQTFVIYVVNYTKFPYITTMLSGKQPGNENYRVPGSRLGTRVMGSDPGTRVPVPSTSHSDKPVCLGLVVLGQYSDGTLSDIVKPKLNIAKDIQDITVTLNFKVFTVRQVCDFRLSELFQFRLISKNELNIKKV